MDEEGWGDVPEELKLSKRLATELVAHLHRMGAGACSIPVDDFIVSVKPKAE